MAERIQRKRTKGWRMPEGAVYVGRPSRWGNPYRAREFCECELQVRMDAGSAVAHFAMYEAPDMFLAPLRGHDLACWCPLDQPCHADVLLDLANVPTAMRGAADKLGEAMGG